MFRGAAERSSLQPWKISEIWPSLWYLIRGCVILTVALLPVPCGIQITTTSCWHRELGPAGGIGNNEEAALIPSIDRIEEQLGGKPKQALADNRFATFH